MTQEAIHLSFRPVVEVFDANTCIGRRRDQWNCCATAAELLNEMDRRGISRALVHHAHAATMDPLVGQAMLEAELAGQDRLVPQTCVLPTDQCLHMLEEFEQRGKLASVRVAFDGRQKQLLTPDFYGPMCEWLQEREIALWVAAAAIDLRDLPAVGRAFPMLNLVLVEAHYTSYLWIKPLLRAVPRLHLELSRYEAFDQVAELAAEFGAERLIYASAHPNYAIGPVLFYLHRCGFAQRDLELICSGNLDRILQRE